MRLGVRLATALGIMLGGGSCGATQTFPLVLSPKVGSHGSRAQSGASSVAANTSFVLGTGKKAREPHGSVSVERIENGRSVVLLQVDQLPPPELLGPGVHAFVVWLDDQHGGEVNLGTLHYDRQRHSGNLLATTELSAFTVRVTAERDATPSEPSDVLLAERRVVPN